MIVAKGGQLFAEGTADCPIIFTYEGDPLDGSSSWTCDNTYILDGYVFVQSGQALNIEAGTVVKGGVLRSTGWDQATAQHQPGDEGDRGGELDGDDSDDGNVSSDEMPFATPTIRLDCDRRNGSCCATPAKASRLRTRLKGGQLFAEGTADCPIIFTYANDPLDGSVSYDTRGQGRHWVRCCRHR